MDFTDDDEELAYILTFNSFPAASFSLYKKLVEKYGGLKEAFHRPETELISINGIGKSFINSLLENKRNNDFGKREIEKCQKNGIKIATFFSDNYPISLKNIHSAPLVLYIKGEIKAEDFISLSVVGTRHPSYYGQRMAEKFAMELSRIGFTIVSGLARGIDTYAHRGALASNGRTIAVLGSGLNKIYPPENKKLAEKISENGAVISEHYLDMPPHAQNFPARNRIISGLSLGVLIIEAPKGSGALITSSWALEQNKDVFAIPGRIDSLQSQGTNQLIKEGAKLVTSIEDIIEEYEIYKDKLKLPAKSEEQNENKNKSELSPDENLIVSALSNEPISLDELSQKVHLPIANISSSLSILEIKKIVKQLPGNLYVLY